MLKTSVQNASIFQALAMQNFAANFTSRLCEIITDYQRFSSRITKVNDEMCQVLSTIAQKNAVFMQIRKNMLGLKKCLKMRAKKQLQSVDLTINYK